MVMMFRRAKARPLGVGMKRERLAWMVSLVLLCVLAFRLPGSLAQR